MRIIQQRDSPCELLPLRSHRVERQNRIRLYATAGTSAQLPTFLARAKVVSIATHVTLGRSASRSHACAPASTHLLNERGCAGLDPSDRVNFTKFSQFIRTTHRKQLRGSFLVVAGRISRLRRRVVDARTRRDRAEGRDSPGCSAGASVAS